MAKSALSREQLISGPLVPTLVALAWPTVISSALNGMFTAIDNVMVAQLGEAPLAAVTAARQVLHLVLVAVGAVGASTGILVSHALGRGDRAEARHVATQAMTAFTVLITLVLVPLGWYGAPWLLTRMAGSDADVLALAVPYARIVVLSLPPNMAAFIALGAMRGAGDAKTPLRLSLWTNLATVGITYALIFGLPWTAFRGYGLFGAAWSNLWSRLVLMVAAYSLFVTTKLVLRLEHPRHWWPNWGLMRRMAELGAPQAASAVLLNLWGVLIIGILNKTPDARAAVAAYGAAMLLRNFGTWVTWGFAEATMAMVGQNYGARRPARAARTGWAAARLALAYLIPASLIIALLGRWLLGLIVNDSPEREAVVLTIGVHFLWSQVPALPLLGAGMAFEGALRGTGDTRSPLVINLVSLYAVGVPLAGLLARRWGADGVWAGMAVGHVLRGLWGAWFWRQKVAGWRRRRPDAWRAARRVAD